jgi:hypothetical protein
MSVEAEELITRNLIAALDRLHEDLDRVELWTAALGCFAHPAPNTSPASSTCCRRSASRGHSAPADSSAARLVFRSRGTRRPLLGSADKLPRSEAPKRAPARPAEALRTGLGGHLSHCGKTLKNADSTIC